MNLSIKERLTILKSKQHYEPLHFVCCKATITHTEAPSIHRPAVRLVAHSSRNDSLDWRAKSIGELFSKSLVFCATLALLPSCRSGTHSPTAETDTCAAAITITVATAESREYIPTLELVGTAEAARSANLGTSLPGRVEHLHCRRGQEVHEGDLLVEMSDEMLVQALIERDALEQDLGRLQRLHAKGTVSSVDLERLKARYEAAESKVSMLKKNTSIRAPFSGTVTRIHVQEGENYSFVPSLTEAYKLESGILQLRQLHPLKIVTAVNERELAALTTGAMATVRFDAYPHDTLQGRVSYIAPELSHSTRSCEIEIEVPNRTKKYKPGMYCKVTLALPPSKGTFVPLQAIAKAQGAVEEFVFSISTDSTVHRQAIRRGVLDGAWVEVEGLEAGVQVAVEGKSKLLEGSRVRVERPREFNAATAPRGGAQ